MEGVETVVLLNNQVEEILPDKPSRDDVLNQLDKINSLWKIKFKISCFMRDESEYEKFLDLFKFIKDKEFSTTNLTFYYEIPKLVYHWFVDYELYEIIDQIAYYIAYQYLYRKIKKFDVSFFENNAPSILWDKVEEKIQEIENTKLERKNILEHRQLYKKFNLGHGNALVTQLTLKYWTLFSEKYKVYPIDPFLYYKSNQSSEWKNIFLDNYDFQLVGYGAYKYYKTIFQNNFQNSPNDYENGYSNKYLETWKHHYKNELSDKSKIDYKVAVVSINSKDKYDYLYICSNVGCYNPLRFEKEYFQSIKKEHDYLCDSCFVKKYLNVKL